MSYKDTLTAINTVYYKSVSANELNASLAELNALLCEPYLNKENRENGEALRMRLSAKILALAYFSDFKEENRKRLEDLIKADMISAEEKGYRNTYNVLKTVSEVAETADKYVRRGEENEARLNCGAVTRALCKETADSLASVKEAAEKLTFPSEPFGAGVKFIDIKGRIIDRLEGLEASAEKLAADMLEVSVSGSLKNISAKYSLYEYYPLPEYDEGGKANTVIVCTPFADEARLFAVHAAKENSDVYEFDTGALDGREEDFMSEIFAFAEKNGCALLASGAENLSESRINMLFAQAMRAGKNGINVFIADKNGDGKLYDKALSLAAKCDSLSSLDVSRTYITMPAYSDVCRELEDKGVITDASGYEKLKNMPFIGFIGLNKIISAYVSDASKWYKTGLKISEANEDGAKRYLKNLTSAFLLIDSGWGDFSSVIEKRTDTPSEFDYDGVRDIDMENVRRIAECGYGVFAKCGMIARYCTTGGGDFTEWDNIGFEEMQARTELATKLVFRFLRINVVPEVKILDTLENSTAGGLCYDGGKKIVYKYDCCKGLQWLLGAIVHESYHALQAKLENGGWTQWFYDNLGITRGRVEQWRYTHGTYDNNTKSNLYKVHIVEADARAFETDCDDARNYYWQMMDFE